ncbi:unnamed protein product [Blepharisma stoltei]|uniref:Uncharacterized protein n=1 Tax=Blepharisma stoltei TaxID=1481888 RepID=A0AAU9JQI0_9CILI|nr:unnamed protein product [Blepharisma stoltei]
MIEIPTEHLSLLLPKFLIDDALETTLCNLKPQLSSDSSDFENSSIQDTPNSYKTLKFSLSPQITPFESRLHTYLFKKSSQIKSESVNLSMLFQDLNFEQEIKNQVSKSPLSLSSELGLSFYNEVIKSIQIFKKKSAKLSAQAKSFNPEDFNKENIPFIQKKLNR